MKTLYKENVGNDGGAVYAIQILRTEAVDWEISSPVVKAELERLLSKPGQIYGVFEQPPSYMRAEYYDDELYSVHSSAAAALKAAKEFAKTGEGLPS
ncbi:MAG: hypothetical protein ABR953_11405 [Candidatus Acidiferrales bacterium]